MAVLVIIIIIIMNGGGMRLLLFLVGIQVVTGHRFLGGFLGSLSKRDEYVMSKVCKWVEHVDVLAGTAVTQPQLAYAALPRSL